MTVLSELATYIASTSHGFTSTLVLASSSADIASGEVPVFRLPIPKLVSGAAIGMVESGSRPSVRAHVGSLGQPVAEHPNVQITVREDSTGYDAARNLSEELYAKLDGLADATLSGTRWLWCTASLPQYIGLDENERHRFVLNLQIRKARS